MLNLSSIHKTFNKGTVNEHKSINDISLKIKEGEFIVVLGSNGAGKSTLMNLLAGTLRPDQGKIMFHDNDVTNWPEYKRSQFIARVFQDPMVGTCPSMTIEENMFLAMKRGSRRTLKSAYQNDQRDFFKSRLKKLNLGLEKRLKDRVGLLSGGQRQAITLLMTNLQRPELVLLDEHTAALDPNISNRTMEITNEMIRESKLTAIMITHNLNHAIQYGDKIIILHRGQIYKVIEKEQKRELTTESLGLLFNKLNYKQ